MLILTNKDVEQVLLMPECVSTLEQAYFDFGNQDAAEIPRQDLLVDNERPEAVTPVRGAMNQNKFLRIRS